MTLAKAKTFFRCEACDYRSPKWLGQCPSCNAWGQMTEGREESGRNAPPPQMQVSLIDYGGIEPERLQRFASGLAN